MPTAHRFALQLPWPFGLRMPLVVLTSWALGLLRNRLLFGRHRAEASRAERPVPPRHHVRQVKVLVQDPDAGPDLFEAWLVKRSLSGLGLSVPRAVGVGNIVNVRIAPAGDVNPWVRVEIRYCRLERGRWALGCKFIGAPASPAPARR